ncbi:MAG TPA: putative Ig domain-containing protein [Gemmataceae bacterium]|nr:putative Ig domain-containing protein [Gemmataceae bacterium]
MTNPGDQASAEGASVSLSISASDSSGTLRYVAFNLPPGLEISTSTGAISGTVGAGDAANGPYTVTVVAGDGTYWASQTFNWTVNNPVTISAPADQTNNEGDTVSLSISASDSTSGTLSYAALGLPPGLKINASTGAITGTVGVGATAAGPYGVTIVAGDGTYSSTQTFNWTVNSPITITPPATQTNNEGDSVSLSVSASDSRSGTTLTYSALGLPPGLAINASTGAISGTVALGDAAVGSYFPTIIVGDGTYYNSQNVEWDVNSPVSITDPGAEANVVGDVVSLQVTAVDASSGTMTYAATGLPAGLSISTSTGLVSGTISSSATDIGFYATTVTVGDGTYVQTDTFGWAVAAAGTVTMTTPSNQSSTEGNSASLSISASDSGSGTLKYIAESLPGGLKINPSTGAITGTLALADAANGPYTVTVIATDGTNSAQETFTWTVSSPVTISTVSAQTNTEGNTVSLSISASDSSSGTLQYSAVGLPAGLAINTGTGAITGTVALGDAANGSYTVTVTAGDGTYSTNLTFTWTVSSPVTVTLPAGQTNAESDTPSLSIGASDSSSGTLLYSAVGLPAGLKINTSTGAITGTVALGTAATGQYSVTVTASDGTYTASQTFDWGINSPVTITPLPLENFSEGNTVSVQVQASDSSSGTLTYVATGLPSGLSINSATGLISGTISSIVAGAGNFLSTIGVMDGTYSSNVTLSYSITAPLLGLASGAVPAQTLADRPSKVSGIGTGLGIAILGPDGKVQYYPDGNPSEKPQPLTPPTTRPEGVTATSVVASPDGSWIFVGLSNGQIEYYKPSDGSYQGTLKLANTPQDGIVAMIPTGQANTLIIVDGKGTVWIYNTVAATITNPGKLSLPVPPKGQSVVWGTTPYGVVMVVGNEMRVYDPKTGKVYTYTITNLPKGAVVTSVVWITIGGKQKLLIGYSLLPGGPSGSLSYGEGDLIEIIRGNKPNPSTSYPAGQGEKNNLTSVFNLVPAKGPDAGKLIQASNTAKGGTIDVLGGGAALKDANNLPQIASMTTTPDGEYLIVAFADGTVGVWKLKDGTKVYPIKKN